MARILHLIDTSSAVYAGSVNTRSFIPGPVVNTGNGYKERTIPTGGLNQLFNIIYKHYNTGTIVFCCDRAPTIKRGIFPEYKTTRTFNERVSIQKEICEYVLNDCGFIVLAEEGYEADDLIYSCVQKFKNQYDHIYVHTGDSDLYLLVDENVSIEPTHSKAKTVNMQNFPYVVKSGKTVPYNTISFQKVLDGDKSKAIEPLDNTLAHKIADSFGQPVYYSLMGNKACMRSLLELTYPEALKQFDLMYPLDAEVPEELIANPDTQRLQAWAYAIRHRLIPNKKGDLEAAINELIEAGLYIE